MVVVRCYTVKGGDIIIEDIEVVDDKITPTEMPVTWIETMFPPGS